MSHTKEEIIKSVTKEIKNALDEYNYGGLLKVIELDEKTQTITIKFDYNIVDDYIGLAAY